MRRFVYGAMCVLFSAANLPANAQTEPKQPNTITTPAPNQPASTNVPVTKVQTDYPGAIWAPAHPENFQKADRPQDSPIELVIVHDIEGSAQSCVSWFQNPKATASSHYVVDSVTGQVYQMVKEHDIGWHAGNRDVNYRSVGIEHGGYAYRPGFFNSVEYESAAKLIRSITERNKIPRDRQHIIGHNEVPNPRRPGYFGGGSGHTDPGPYWDWDTLMTLIRNDARLVKREIPSVIHPGEILPATVVMRNIGDDAWVANNSGREDARVVEQGGGVYLGTWAPAQRASTFFNYKFWTSPTLASSVVNGDAAPATEGTFQFSLLGPRRYGAYVEQFRVTKYPPAPKRPVPFGEIVTAVVRVEPWEIDKLVSGDGFQAPGWNAKPGAVWKKTGEGKPVEWTTTLPINGQWEILARWPEGVGRTKKAQFQVVDATGAHMVSVDQTRSGGKWVSMGEFKFTDPKDVKVRLSSVGAPGIVAVDGIRFKGPIEE